MDANFTAATRFTSHEEGGYVSDPRDSGNWSTGIVHVGTLIGSNMGVGAPALIAWNRRVRDVGTITAEYMRALPLGAYQAIAALSYWRVMPCTEVPAGVDLSLFDYGWNRGPLNSTLQLQEALGVAIDGQFGPRSQAAMDAIGDVSSFLVLLAAVQVRHYRTLTNFDIYGKDWIGRTGRRLDAAQALAAAVHAAT